MHIDEKSMIDGMYGIKERRGRTRLVRLCRGPIVRLFVRLSRRNGSVGGYFACRPAQGGRSLLMCHGNAVKATP